MQILQSTISLNVDDVEASSTWAQRHLGYEVAMAAEGFVSLTHPTAGLALVYLATGLPTFRPSAAAGHADGLLVVFTVEDVDAEHERMRAQGATVVTPPETEPWGERYAQYADPNGVVYQLVTWVTSPDAPDALDAPDAQVSAGASHPG
ncbi:hypothetical protein GCM10027517_04680 [Phycicoccus ginsengisoli]